jgi:2'-5' RNA ligase superfamily protein
MAYLAIIYPELQQSDLDWIQKYRSQHDARYYSLVKPHISLVFPVYDIGQLDFAAEVKRQAAGIHAFDFQIKVATVNQDNFDKYFHEFLVPDMGYSDIVKLHDKLYSDKLAKYWRYDIDYIPHIGIGNSEDVRESKKRVDELNTTDILLPGRVTTIDIVEFADGKVTTLEQLHLPNG